MFPISSMTTKLESRHGVGYDDDGDDDDDDDDDGEGGDDGC